MYKQLSALKSVFAVAIVASSFIAVAPGISQTEPTMPRRENTTQNNRENVNQQNPSANQNQLGQEPSNTNVGPIDDDPWIRYCFYNVPAEELDDCINGLPSTRPNDEVDELSVPSRAPSR